MWCCASSRGASVAMRETGELGLGCIGQNTCDWPAGVVRSVLFRTADPLGSPSQGPSSAAGCDCRYVFIRGVCVTTVDYESCVCVCVCVCV